jgi:hypothetical protein
MPRSRPFGSRESGGVADESNKGIDGSPTTAGASNPGAMDLSGDCQCGQSPVWCAWVIPLAPRRHDPQ